MITSFLLVPSFQCNPLRVFSWIAVRGTPHAPRSQAGLQFFVRRGCHSTRVAPAFAHRIYCLPVPTRMLQGTSCAPQRRLWARRTALKLSPHSMKGRPLSWLAGTRPLPMRFGVRGHEPGTPVSAGRPALSGHANSVATVSDVSRDWLAGRLVSLSAAGVGRIRVFSECPRRHVSFGFHRMLVRDPPPVASSCHWGC